MTSVLTLNAALLTVTLFGKPIYTFQSNPAERFHKLIKYINDSHYDVICLQEISIYWQKQLVPLVKAFFPYVTHYEVAGKVFPAELLILSRTPLTDVHFRYYQFATGFEHAGILKGVLFANVDMGGKPYTIANTHLVANGFFRAPTTRIVEMVRGQQIRELEHLIGEKLLRDHKRVVVLAGDFNAGPEASPSNYNKMANAFEDLFVHDEKLHGKHEEQYTWMVKNDDNVMTRLMQGSDCPDQRIDLFWVPKSQMQSLGNNIETSIVHNDFSDHYGVELVLR